MADFVTGNRDSIPPLVGPIVERCRFHSHSRKESESVAEFVAELRHLSTYCNFGTNLNDTMRDRIVCGINSPDIQKKLLSVGNSLTLDKTLKLAISLEAAARNAESLPHGFGGTPNIHKFDGANCN